MIKRTLVQHGLSAKDVPIITCVWKWDKKNNIIVAQDDFSKKYISGLGRELWLLIDGNKSVHGLIKEAIKKGFGGEETIACLEELKREELIDLDCNLSIWSEDEK